MDTEGKDAQKEMAAQISGFTALGRFRSYAYRVAVTIALVVGVAQGLQEGLRRGMVTAFLGLIFGVAGVRLLTAPVGAFLWYRNWKCPACQKRLGMGLIKKCPHCGAQLFA